MTSRDQVALVESVLSEVRTGGVVGSDAPYRARSQPSSACARRLTAVNCKQWDPIGMRRWRRPETQH